jgi:predicted signal transduction protein with EAL and GGDEF domain
MLTPERSLVTTSGIVTAASSRDRPAVIGTCVEAAMDDFGIGFSSRTRLKHLSVDTLDVDRLFVGGIATSETDREIVRTIILLRGAVVSGGSSGVRPSPREGLNARRC